MSLKGLCLTAYQKTLKSGELLSYSQPLKVCLEVFAVCR